MNTGNQMGPGMPARELTVWAKEMMLEFIDRGLEEVTGVDDFDERAALRKQRNRVARFLECC